jgi:hypothetical protein
MSNIRESTSEQLHRLSIMIISEMTTKEWAHRNAVEYYEHREEEQDEEIARLKADIVLLEGEIGLLKGDAT